MDFRFIPFDEARRPAWDAFVAANPHAWVGHDSACIDFEQSLGHESFSHLILDERDNVVGVTPLFFVSCTRARLFKFRAMVTGTSLRAAPLADAKMPPKTRRDFWRAWASWAQSEAAARGVDEIRVGFPHFVGAERVFDFYEFSPLREFGFVDLPNLTMLKDLEAAGPDMLATLDKHCRNSLRKALSAGAEWVAIIDRDQWLAFEDLNKQTFAEEAADAYSRRTLEIIWDRFVARGIARVAALRHEGRYLCASVRTGNKNSEYNWMLFNERPRTLKGSTNLFICRDLEDMRARGIRWCELGSMEFDDPRQRGIADFKRSFGGRIYFSMDCKLTLSPLKAASADFIQALAKRLRPPRQTPAQSSTD